MEPSIHEASAIWSPALAGQFVVPLLLLEAVVVRQLLANADVLAREKDEVRLPVHFKHLGVHAGGAAVVLQQSEKRVRVVSGISVGSMLGDLQSNSCMKIALTAF